MAGKTTTGTKAPSGNLDLWNRLSQTDPSATKPFNNGRFNGTQIDPYYRYKLMTEVFGPIGKGWGYELTDPIFNGAMVFIGAKAWYVDTDTKEKLWSSIQYGGDVLVKGAKGTPNDEALKMAVTDAVGKALSLIGVAADVYAGQYDDSKYREEMAVLHDLKKEYTPQKIEKFEADTIGDIVELETVAAIEDYYRQTDFREVLRCVGIVDKNAKARIMDALSNRKRELVEADEAERRAAKTGKGQQPAATADEPTDDTSETGEHPGYEGSIQQQADRDQAEFYEQEEQRQGQPEEPRKEEPKQAPVYEFDVTDYVTKPAKSLPVQEPNEESPDWERFAVIALKIVQNLPDEEWGQRWMNINGGTIDRLEKQGIIMERDGVKYTGAQAANWIDKSFNKRMAALVDGGNRRRERAGAD